ncbi:MAG: NADH-quinone oxidoreductase subunit C [Eggerthellaceae bacterium]|nr:NADH-quinone oxidoreductase subunit C [Eggerthellaceae bacterium]
MAFEMEFTPIALADLHREAAVKKTDGWRFIQTHAVNTDNGIDLYYSFMKNGRVDNLKVSGVTKDQPVPSITDLFLAAFVFENEARELFGVDMRDIAIDFAGALYAPAEFEPMTFISPEQKAAREKARKAQEAKAAKEAGASEAEAAPSGKARVFVMTPERRERLDKKLANMSPEKVAKVEAALKAREAEAASAASAPVEKAASAASEPSGQDAAPKKDVAAAQASDTAPETDYQLERAIALLDTEKAAKVREALALRAGEPVQSGEEPVSAPAISDAALEAKIALMDEAKAEKVREALAAKAAREASSKGGE